MKFFLFFNPDVYFRLLFEIKKKIVYFILTPLYVLYELM